MAIQTIAFIRELVTKARAEIPVLGNRVGYSAEFLALRELYDEYELPYVFIVPIGSTPTFIHGGDTSKQRVRYNFSTFICVDNSNREKNTQELNPHEQIEFIISQLWRSFIGYNPEALIQSDTIIYNGDFLHEMTHEKLWWQVNWYVEHLLDMSNPAYCPEEDPYTIDEVWSRGFINGLEAISSDQPDYNTKIDGCFQGGDGVVDNDEATNPFEGDC